MARNYESDLTLLLKQHKTDHPDTEARQRYGRSLLWDHNLDPDEQSGFKTAQVPMSPYVYYDNLRNDGTKGYHANYPPTMQFEDGWKA